MMNLTKVIVTCGLVLGTLFLQAQETKYKPDKELLSVIAADYATAGEQYKYMMKELAPDSARFPKTYYAAINKLETSGSGWWCSGFYPGTLLNIYRETGDASLLTEANRALGLLAKEQYNKSTHDLGFMMYCSFGTAEKIEPKPEYREILLNSAKSLITRFDPKVGCIKSWDSKKPEYLVIIDNMMNLELLFWATRVTGDSNFYKIAVTHANTTLKNHFRPDYSSYHVVVYNPRTGEVLQKRTAQGYANESAWARGQAWGLYGYTVLYRETKDTKYLDQARHIAGFILNNPNLPKDKIPYWDYNAPNIPDALRDASAGAVMAAALLELCRYSGGKEGKRYFSTAETIIRNLSSVPYKAAAGTNGGFLLQHSVGSLPGKSEVDVPLTYADYYFTEALERYKNIGKATDTLHAPAAVLKGVYADPDIAVFGRKFYLYPTTDGTKGWLSTSFTCWSSANLVDWKNEGVILDLPRDLTWAKERAWAPAIACKNNKYYYYYSADVNIGVAVSDRPTGPFRDPIGKPLIKKGTRRGQMIDPMVFVDNDGSAYLYFGQGQCNVVKLNEDMMSCDTSQILSFKPPGYNEGPFVIKRKGIYYLMWSEYDTRDPRYSVAYATASSPLGPFTKASGDPILKGQGVVKG
jgi:hypothetical protein